jgi:photosystem II stability/assembly factor-like uncharacterized protein
MHKLTSRGIALAALLVACRAATAAPSADVTSSLEWRLVGPHRAGWATAAAGAGNESETFYLGAAGGGVWKSDDAGDTWNAVFDGVGSASVGALAVAPTNPDVLYVGMGQVTSRYDIAAGDGVYRSDDAGSTWRHVGLAASRHIGALKVHPENPDIAWVAALGPAFGPGGERGVYRTSDGGKSWQRTLFVNEDTGAVDIALDPSDPNVLYAATWQVRYRPWLAYFTPDVGPGSALYKSTDGGMNWKRIEGGGWPSGTLGRIGLAASARAQGTRVWAVVDAVTGGGLYRSDDAGATWVHANADKELVNSYFARLTAVPGEPDVVYAMGRSIRRCTEGGTKCEIVKGAPGGDDYHFLWIDPRRPERMITGADQGAALTLNGGRTWTDWYNQPTGQFYKLATDDSFPYRIYAGQQDNGTVRIASRSDYGSISYRDWEPVGADERDYEIPDPRDPDIVYGSGLGGRLSRWNARNGEVQNVSPWPISSYGQRLTAFRQRYSWITPIAMSKIDPYPLYFGSQSLWRSTDQGATWEVLGPDLSAAARPSAKECKGELDPAHARACGYGVIWSIGLSTRDNSEIWVGTDDGLVRLTRDGGKSWADVTPKAVPAWAKVATVEPSPTTPGTAYIAVDNHRQNDFRPFVYRTRDYGKSWVLVSQGLPTDHFVGVVRADTVCAGLIYAGTETGVFVSVDGGEHWQTLQRNLPVAWVRDIAVHDNDLIVATQGRAIWVLDDLSPLRQHDAVTAGTSEHLFNPATAMRLRKNQNRDTPLPKETPAGRNPPTGAVIDYWLAGPASRVELEIRDAAGAVVRMYSSDDPPPPVEVERYFSADWIVPAESPATSAGMHRFTWDLRYPRPRSTEYEYLLSTAYGMGVPVVPQGPVVAPGQYRVTLRVDGREQSAPLTVAMDPRVPVDAAALSASLALSREIRALLERHYEGEAELEYVGEAADELRKEQSGNAKAMRALEYFDKRLAPLRTGVGDRADDLNLKAIGGVLRSTATDLESTDRAPTEPQRRVVAETAGRLERALAAWKQLRDTELPGLNAELVSAGLKPIEIPPVDKIRLSGPSASREMP